MIKDIFTYSLRPTPLKRVLFFLILDVFLSLFTLYFAYELRFNFQVPHSFYSSFFLIFSLLILLKIAFIYSYKLYFTIWRFFALTEAKRLFYAHLFSYLAFTLIYLLFSEVFAPFARSIIIIDFLLSLFALSFLRISKRLIIENSIDNSLKPALIIGVGSNTSTLIKSAFSGEFDYYLNTIIALPHQKDSVNTYIQNIKIHAFESLTEIIENSNFQTAIITVSDLETNDIKELFETLKSLGIKEIKTMKLLGSEHEKLSDLSIEDLLARHPKDLDTKAIASFIKGKRVLITGAGGSIGSEISRQCHAFGAKNLILVDHSEYNLYAIGQQLPSALLKLLNITHYKKLETVFNEESIDVVIHAAAYKHVPLCEANMNVAIENNILGSKNVIDLAIASNVSKMVIISTDKAVRPTNVMGCTKRISELYAQNIDPQNTEIVSVRFGNVLGSSGSVIPKFKEQIENGGPVTVTHPEMTRFFMLIPEACQLVLQAASIARGGELFVLDMGESVKIVDLANKMIQLYNKEDEIKVIFTGLRPGEKLYEELLIDENEKKTIFESIFIAPPSHYDIKTLKEDIKNLISSPTPLKELKRIVPEFNHNP